MRGHEREMSNFYYTGTGLLVCVFPPWLVDLDRNAIAVCVAEPRTSNICAWGHDVLGALRLIMALLTCGATSSFRWFAVFSEPADKIPTALGALRQLRELGLQNNLLKGDNLLVSSTLHIAFRGLSIGRALRTIFILSRKIAPAGRLMMTVGGTKVVEP